MCFAQLLTRYLQVAYIGDNDLFFQYVPLYLQDATARMQKYAPEGFTFNVNDTYAMQSICAYETGFIGRVAYAHSALSCDTETFSQARATSVISSPKMNGPVLSRRLVSRSRRNHIENLSSVPLILMADIEYYYDYGYVSRQGVLSSISDSQVQGNPTGRAQGVGYQQELLARLTNQYIYNSNSSVNSTITNNPKHFPLGQPFYADFSHDDIIISALASMSVDYFREAPSLSEYPPDPERHFNLARYFEPFLLAVARF